MDAIALVIVFTMLIGDFVFPIYVAVRAWRKGHREWTWATLASLIILFLILATLPEHVSAFFSISILLFPVVVSAIAWIKTKEHLAVPINCSKCGELSRAIRRITLDQATGEKVQSRFTGIIWLTSGLACLILFLWMLVSFLTWSGPRVTFNGIAIIFPLVIGIPMIRTGFNILARIPAIPIKEIEYKCTACGYVFIPGSELPKLSKETKIE